MSNIIPETFYGTGPEPQWLVESPPRELQSHFDRRGCVRQIRTTTTSSHSHSHPVGHNHSQNDMPPRSTSSRHSAGSGPMMPSVVRAVADRQAGAAPYVYNAVPASHRTFVERPALNELDAVFNVPIVEFEVPMCCGKCEEKVIEELENYEGVYKVVCDLHNQRVTVASTSDPHGLLKRVKRIKKHSYFWNGSTHRSTANVEHLQYQAPDPAYRSHKSSPWARRHSQQQSAAMSLPQPSRHGLQQHVAAGSPVHDIHSNRRPSHTTSRQSSTVRPHINHMVSPSREYSSVLEPGVMAPEAPPYLMMKRKAVGDADPEPYGNHSTRTGSAEYQYSMSASPSTYKTSLNVYDHAPVMYQSSLNVYDHAPERYQSAVNVYDHHAPEMYDVMAHTPFVEIPRPWN